MSNSRWDILQEMLDLDVGAELQATARRQIDRRGSLSLMVDFALDRRYATSLGDLLDQTANLRQHKLFNALLASLQRPHSDYLLQAHDWESRWRRKVLPTEHPIVLMVPFAPVGFYFDVSQTEETEASRKMPAQFENPYRMKYVNDAEAALAALKVKVLHDGVRISNAPLGNRFAGHIRRATGGFQQVPVRVGNRTVIEKRPVRFEVALNRNYGATEQLATLAHEVGHLYCGHLGARRSDVWPDRSDVGDESVREFEAESVARLVFRRIAPDAVLPDHLEQYFRPGEPVPDAGWARVVSASDRIIDHCISSISESADSVRLGQGSGGSRD